MIGIPLPLLSKSLTGHGRKDCDDVASTVGPNITFLMFRSYEFIIQSHICRSKCFRRHTVPLLIAKQEITIYLFCEHIILRHNKYTTREFSQKLSYYLGFCRRAAHCTRNHETFILLSFYRPIAQTDATLKNSLLKKT